MNEEVSLALSAYRDAKRLRKMRSKEWGRQCLVVALVELIRVKARYGMACATHEAELNSLYSYKRSARKKTAPQKPRSKDPNESRGNDLGPKLVKTKKKRGGKVVSEFEKRGTAIKNHHFILT